MLTLALDTTNRAGSCALARDGHVVSERAGDAVRPQASRLPGELMALLHDAGVALDAVDTFAVATGPGSFTGLRVGIAAMQGLAFATGKPLIGISALDALAQVARDGASRAGDRDARVAAPSMPVDLPRWTATWVDAWRGEVYAALYDDGVEVAPPTVEPPATVLARLAGQGRVLFVGDGAASARAQIVATLGEAAVFADPVVPRLAGPLARLAEAAARDGLRPPPHAIRPLYVRRPDAELARDARAAR